MKSIGGIAFYKTAPKLFYATRNNKFAKEKVNFEDENFTVYFDGIILNNQELFKEYDCNNNCDLLLKLYKEYGAGLVFYAKGAYALSIYDKKFESMLITNDLLSKRSLYYNINDDGVCFAGSYYDLMDLLAKTNYSCEVDVSAVRDMMNFGMLNGKKTYLKDVFYLNAFESIVVNLKTQSAAVIRHEIKNQTLPENQDQLLSKFDELFTKAVKLQFEKNVEYGYKQVATLSGGMDSRACLLKGINAGYGKDLLCFNYAQSGSLDFQISQQIANDYGLDYIFYPMDSALFINRSKNAMACNECQQSALGSTAANTVANIIDTSQFGIINIGICGGELMGDLIRAKGDSNSYLNKVIRPFRNKNHKLEYDSKDLFKHLRGCQNFAYMFLDKCEAISPFMDEDVFTFVMQIEPKYLYNRNFYFKWMRKYLPNKYVLTHTCCPLDASPLKIVLTKVKYEIKRLLTGNSAKEMNPFEMWFDKNPTFKTNLKVEYQQLCQTISGEVGAKEVLELANGKWAENWRVNAFVVTALNAVSDVYKKFKK